MAKTQKPFFRFSTLFNVRNTVILLCLMLMGWLGAAFVLDRKTIFLPGVTSNGHILFEASCASCHEGFKPVTNETCVRCHEVEMATDAHGPKKFNDLRWAAELEKLEVLTCTTCHNEHVHMFGRGVHLQPDLCMTCHEGIVQGELASHNNFSPDGCWTAGCHNFHDHRSISTGFLRKNMGQADMLPKPALPDRTFTPEFKSSPQPDLGKEFVGGKV